MKRSLPLTWSALLLLAVIFFSSCGSNTRKLTYFDNIEDTVLRVNFNNLEPAIQVNDLLSIVISSSDAEASAIYNAPNESSFTASSASTATNRLTIGYLVDPKGEIHFPVLGKIRVTGMTKSQLTSYLAKELNDRKLLVDAIATVRQLNFRVSVLGEVARPGVFSVPNEKLTLLEALSFAGDITIYGKKNNVLLIRENDKGEKTIRRVDLTTRSVLTSEYYYLRSNDIVYVEPSKNRVARENNAQIFPIVISIISLGMIAITNLK